MQTEGSRWRYLGVYLLAAFTNIFVRIIFSDVYFTSFRTANLNGLILFYCIINVIIWSLIVISIYKSFSSINKTKVIKWIWVFSFIGAITSAGQVVTIFPKDTAPGPLVLLSFFCSLFCGAIFHITFKTDYLRFENHDDEFALNDSQIIKSKTEINPNKSKASESSKNVNSNNSDFDIAAGLFPDLKEQYNYLSRYGLSVQHKFIDKVLETKEFKLTQPIVDSLIEDEIVRRFGASLAAKELAIDLYKANKQTDLNDLENIVRVVGSSFQSEEAQKFRDRVQDQIKRKILEIKSHDDQFVIFLRDGNVIGWDGKQYSKFSNLHEFRGATNYWKDFETIVPADNWEEIIRSFNLKSFLK